VGSREFGKMVLSCGTAGRGKGGAPRISESWLQVVQQQRRQNVGTKDLFKMMESCAPKRCARRSSESWLEVVLKLARSKGGHFGTLKDG